MRRSFRFFGFILLWLAAASILCARTPRDSATADSAPSTIVVIDAGHGGHDRGGIPGQRVAEKNMTLDVAQRLHAVLAANGYRTVMTRNSDVFVPLPTRVAIANSYRDAIFVCIHFNAASRRGANGVETYFYTSQSLPLASAIHYCLARATPSSNRGVRRRGYYVLRRTRIPSVLVECGFLTNPSEAEYAQTAKYRQMLAEQIALGIRSRSLVGSSSRLATAGTIPLQPYLDQTRMSHPSRSASRHKVRKKSRTRRTTATHEKQSSKIDGDGSAVATKKKATQNSED
jgi:N-acetylmuramoyl-L-alanine amidase